MCLDVHIWLHEYPSIIVFRARHRGCCSPEQKPWLWRMFLRTPDASVNFHKSGRGCGRCASALLMGLGSNVTCRGFATISCGLINAFSLLIGNCDDIGRKASHHERSLGYLGLWQCDTLRYCQQRFCLHPKKLHRSITEQGGRLRTLCNLSTAETCGWHEIRRGRRLANLSWTCYLSCWETPWLTVNMYLKRGWVWNHYRYWMDSKP